MGSLPLLGLLLGPLVIDPGPKVSSEKWASSCSRASYWLTLLLLP